MQNIRANHPLIAGLLGFEQLTTPTYPPTSTTPQQMTNSVAGLSIDLRERTIFSLSQAPGISPRERTLRYMEVVSKMESLGREE